MELQEHMNGKVLQNFIGRWYFSDNVKALFNCSHFLELIVTLSL